MVLSASIFGKNLFRNIKDEIILEVFKINHRKAYEKTKHWRLRGYEKIIREEHLNCLFHKRNILRQNKREAEHFYKKIVKKVMIKAGIPPSINEETVCRVLWKTDLKWSRFQRNQMLAKNDVKLRLDFARKVCHERVMCNNEIRNRWY